MIPALSIALCLAAVCYAVLIGCFAVGLRRVQRAHTPPEPASWPFVSVVVAARNEAAGIEPCLHSILDNDYPPERFEVIVVDDFSEDETPALVRRLQHRPRRLAAGEDVAVAVAAPPLRLVQMRDLAMETAGHKFHAVHQGIDAAAGEIILTTDADCTVSPRWIRTMAACFTPAAGFVAGPVRYRPGRTRFGRLQSLEFLALVATGAGGIGLGRPNMCNSANVGYRREVYARFGARRHDGAVSAGEDEILAQRLAAETAWRVRFCADPAAIVETDPVLDVRRFWAQRRRWAATGPRYPRTGLVAAILGVYVFYVLLLASLAALPLASALWPAVALALGLKILSEAALVYPACRHFGESGLFRYFLPGQLVQIPYVVLVGASAALGGTHWKGRDVLR